MSDQNAPFLKIRDQSAQTILRRSGTRWTPVLMPKEELKFSFTASDLPLSKQALLKTTDNGRTTHTTLTSTYYDTAPASLKRAGVALRVQEQNRRYIQTVIATSVSGVLPLSCGECEDVIDSERPDPHAPNSSAHLPETLGEAELLVQFTGVFRRTLFVLEPDGSTQIECALDEGELRTAASDRTEPICEVGLQLKRGDPAALYATGLRLLEIAPLRIEIRSEAERGYDLLGGTIDKPQVEHTPPFDLKPDMTVEESLQRIGRGCLTMLLRNEATALADVPEGVHQIRVAVRRLRSTELTLYPRRFCTRSALVHGVEMAERRVRTSGCVTRRGPRLPRRTCATTF
jgi:inorganic triphosphatase YgiF